MTEFRKQRLLDVAQNVRGAIETCEKALAYAGSDKEKARIIAREFGTIRAHAIWLEDQLQKAAQQAA